jgi:hypothetical protein
MSLQTIQSSLESLSDNANLQFSTIAPLLPSIGTIIAQLPPLGNSMLTNNTFALSGTGADEKLTVLSSYDWNLMQGIQVGMIIMNDPSTAGDYVIRLTFNAPSTDILSIPGLDWFTLGQFAIMGENPPYATTQSELAIPVIIAIETTLILTGDSSSTSLPVRITTGFNGLTLSLNAAAVDLPSINDILAAFGTDQSAILLPDTLNQLLNFSLLQIYVNFQYDASSTNISLIGVQIGNSASASGGWPIIPGFLILESYKIGVNIANPLTPATLSAGGLIEATAMLGTVDIGIAAVHPATGGWEFKGYIGENDPVQLGALLSGFASQFGVTLPDVLNSFTLKNFELSFDTFSYDVSGQFTLDFTVNNTAVELTASAALAYNTNAYTAKVTGQLTIGQSVFTVTFSDLPNNMTFSANWQGDANNPLQLEDIATCFGFTLPAIPSSLDLALVSAGLTYNFTNNTLVLEASSATFGNAVFVAYINTITSSWQFYFGLLVNNPINLSNLPLINLVLPSDETIEIDNLQVLIASAPFDPNNTNDNNEISYINKLIGTGYPLIPATGLPGTVAVSLVFDFGGYTFPLSIGTPAQSNGSSSSGAGTSVGTGSGNSTGAVPPPLQAADGTTWFSVQKSFGPVNFEKVGVKYEDGTLWFSIDASLTAAGLTISVQGLSVGSPLTNFDPSFNISGLGINYSNADVTIGGSFVNMPVTAPITLQFGGTATIEIKPIGISATGAYTEFSDQTSMFIFASLNAPFGGPLFFFITGFCGGFGYNSNLRMPTQNEVYQFPFVASLANPALLGNNPTPTSVLQNLMGGTTPWVTPSVGGIWLSAGINFSTYEVVTSTALVVAQFGNKFLLGLIGLSTGRFPMQEPDPYAYVQMQLEVIFDPSDGVISCAAALSPNSFVLDKACHLTGGFAIFFWFGSNPYAGDFVITLGGYSPYYTPPDYYPQESRLGLNWALDSTISISGGVYFALTPAAIMAGGSLNVTYRSDNIKAWFTADTDVIIWYNPFHFIATMGVSVGASYKADLLFCSEEITVELGASLSLWGPATGGTITVHWFVVSITINFGAGESNGLDKQTWTDFVKVLPAPADVVKIVPVTGLLSGQPLPTSSAPATPPTWMVRADSFQFTTTCSVPLTELYIAGNSSPVKTGSPLNIQPMEATQLTSSKTLSIISKDTGQNVLDNTWNISFLTASLPVSLWGTGSNTTLPTGDQLLTGQLTGFQIQVPLPVLGAGTGDINIRDDLQYDPLLPGVSPLQTGQTPQGPVPAASNNTIACIEQIMSTNVQSQRDDIFNTFSQLGLQGLTNGDLSNLAANAGALFTNEPLLINS